MKLKKVLCILFISAFFFCAAGAGEGTVLEAFHSGNAFYEKGETSKAIEQYEKILKSGDTSAAVYYNLGNAYFRAGKIGKAILNYERARRLKPEDPDVMANYRFVKAKVGGPVADEKVSLWDWRPLRKYNNYFTVDGIVAVASCVYVFAVIFMFIGLLGRSFSLKAKWIAGILFVVMLFNLFVAWHKINAIGKEAVIIVSSAEAHYGPSEAATVFFKMNEGTEVFILGAKDDWCKVRRSDGKIGWIKKDGVEKI